MKPTKKLLEFLGKFSTPILFLFSFSLIIGINALDCFTRDFSFVIFNLAPIFLITWFVGIEAGIFMSCAGALSYLIINIVKAPANSSLLAHYWNAAAQLAFFVLASCFLLELKKSLIRERELTTRDPVTGALNGRTFFELARREINRSRRYKEAFTFAYMDADDFGSINAYYGHAKGNELLRTAADTITKNLRTVDIVSRLEDDKFAILMPKTDHKGAAIVMPRIRDLLSAAMRDNGWSSTFSIGVVTYDTPPDSIDTMIRKSDSLMYQAKNLGKDMIKYEVSG